jgi:UDP-GlcNAc:undecaprenyl-phosphate GlcNAc-1-phosphate transferase
MWTLAYLYIWAFSFLLSLLTVKMSLKLALRLKILDEPSHRKIQIRPIPLLGGLGIMLAFYGTLVFNLILLKLIVYFPSLAAGLPQEILEYAPNAFRLSARLIAILSGGFIVFIIGLVDDFNDLGVWPKLIVQMLAAAILWFSGIRITFFSPNLGVSLFLTVIWVVAIINAFNLLDNMDGLSGGIAFISALFLLMISSSQNQFFVSIFLSAFAGSLLGFLFFNFNPAKIFMGDAGSYFIGFIMASTTILGTYYHENSSTLFSILMPVLVLGVPLYDLCSVMLIRLYERRPIFQGDRKHFSHRILDLGMSQREVVFFLYLVSFAFGTSSLLLGRVKETGVYLVFLQSLAFIAIIALLEYFARRKSK